jgi:hypothetical protein
MIKIFAVAGLLNKDIQLKSATPMQLNRKSKVGLQKK